MQNAETNAVDMRTEDKNNKNRNMKQRPTACMVK